MFVLTGIAKFRFRGRSSDEWFADKLLIIIELPDVIPQGQGLLVQNWAPYLGIASMFNAGGPVNSGFAINAFWLQDVVDPVRSIGLYATIAARDRDAFILRASYHVTLVGVFGPLPPPPG